MGICALTAVINCSKIPENNDPILGIWVRSSTETTTQSNTQPLQVKEEWIFNDVFLGRYQIYHNNSLHYYTDYAWELEGETYLIDYYGTDFPKDTVRMTSSQPQQLLLNSGELFAEKE